MTADPGRAERFEGAIALVTGAASGIGWAVAERLHAEGAVVTGLDIVANVAGIPQFGRVDDLTDVEWARQLDVNLSGPFRVCRAALPALRSSRGCGRRHAAAGARGRPDPERR